MSDETDWPREGTRVRILATQQEGMVLYGLTTKLDPIRWVELYVRNDGPVETWVPVPVVAKQFEHEPVRHVCTAKRIYARLMR